MSEQISIEIEIPEVEETAYKIEVRCGETSVDVHEYGHRGSGAWVAWLSTGYTVEHTRSDNQMTTCNRAQDYVIAQERKRLAHEALRATLDGTK